MIGINNSMKLSIMPENCGMKGMHENHVKQVQTIEKQKLAPNDKNYDEKVGSKLDVTV